MILPGRSETIAEDQIFSEVVGFLANGYDLCNNG